MAQVIVRNLDPETVARLKAQAKRHGRSLEAELRSILAQTASDAANDEFLAWTREHRLPALAGADLEDLIAAGRDERTHGILDAARSPRR